MTTEKRILKMARNDSLILVKLCQQWQPKEREDKQPIVDPVTCVRKYHKAKMLFPVYTLLWIVSYVSSFLLFCWTMSGATGYDKGSIYIGPIFLMVLLGVLCSIFYHFPFSWRCWEFANAIDFIKAIKQGEKWSLVDSLLEKKSIEGWFVLSEICKDVKFGLTQEAWEINYERTFPWNSGNAEASFNEWKETHALMKRLFKDLPTDYNDYFPRNEEKVSPSISKEIAPSPDSSNWEISPTSV